MTNHSPAALEMARQMAELTGWETDIEPFASVIDAGNAELVNAVVALLADVRRRYPGEELRCPFMIKLDAARSKYSVLE
jgi:hypothetical protein